MLYPQLEHETTDINIVEFRDSMVKAIRKLAVDTDPTITHTSTMLSGALSLALCCESFAVVSFFASFFVLYCIVLYC
jgi:hypothetical protein